MRKVKQTMSTLVFSVSILVACGSNTKAPSKSPDEPPVSNNANTLGKSSSKPPESDSSDTALAEAESEPECAALSPATVNCSVSRGAGSTAQIVTRTYALKGGEYCEKNLRGRNLLVRELRSSSSPLTITEAKRIACQ